MRNRAQQFIGCLLGVAAALALASPAVAQDQADRAWRAGLQAFQGGNPAECVRQMQTALAVGGEAYERWGWLHMMLGICLGQSNLRDAAISELLTAKPLVTQDVERFQVNHALAQVYVGRGGPGDYDLAIAAEREAAPLASNRNQQALVAKTLGQAHYFKGDWANAIQHLSEAASTRQADSDVAQKLGRAYREAGNAVEAKRWLEKALSLDPGNALAARTLGTIKLDEGDAEAALPLLQRAAAQDATDPWARYEMGRAYAMLGRTDEAVVELRAAADTAPPELARMIDELLAGGDEAADTASSSLPAPPDNVAVVAEYSGNGTRNTRPFSVTDEWELQWNATGDVFQAYLHDAATGEMTEVLANQTGAGASSSFVLRGGRFFLSVNAIGDWSLRIVQINR